MLLAACVAAPAPASSSASAVPSVRGGTLRVAQAQDITTLDPWSAADDDTLFVLRQVFQSLVDLDPATGQPAPLLALRWAASPDARVWTFTLRSGVHFHDGSALDAAAVAFNFERGRAMPRTGLDALLESVAAPDASTVVFTLRSGYAPFIALLAAPSFAVVSPACVKQGVTWSTPATRCAAGTGPFRIEPGAWESGTRVKLVRNASYWASDAGGRKLPYLDGITFTAVRDENTRVGALKAAQVDLAMDLAPGGGRALQSDPNLALAQRPPFGSVFVAFGAAPAVGSSDIRRAVALSLDRVGVVQAVYGGDARTAPQLVPPGVLGFDDTVMQFTPTDVAAAKKLLADAGRANGFATELWYSPETSLALPDPKRVADSIAADLAKIGVTAAVRSEDADAYAADARAGRLAIWIGVRSPATADADEFLADATTDPIALELLRRARAELDTSKRAELYKQISKLIQQQVSRVPLVYAVPPIGSSRKVNGFIPRAVGGESLLTVWMGQ